MIISLDCPLVISGRCILAKDSYIESHGSTLCNLDKRLHWNVYHYYARFCKRDVIQSIFNIVLNVRAKVWDGMSTYFINKRPV